MLALIRMDWTLLRPLLFRWSPLFMGMLAMGLAGTRMEVLISGLLLAEFGIGYPLFHDLGPHSIDPYVSALPVSPAQIVGARYLSAGMALLAAFSLPLVAGAVARVFGLKAMPGLAFSDAALGLLLMALLLSSVLFLYLPFHFRFGGERGLGAFAAASLGGLLILFFALGPTRLLPLSLDPFLEVLGRPLLFLGALGAWAHLAAASLQLSMAAYRRRTSLKPLSAFLPFLFLGVVFGGLGVLAHRHLARVSEARMERDMEALVAPRFQPRQPGAAILILRDGKPLLRAGYGFADLAGRTPMSPDTVLPILSVTKQFTAALVMLMVEAGKIQLERPIRDYVAEVPAAWSKVTVAQCLAHTGGLPNFSASPEFEAGVDRSLRPTQVLETYVRDLPLEFEPGSRWAYSNTGYLLLGMALERTTGQDFATLIRDRIARPLGLRATRFETGRPALQGYSKGGVSASAFSPYQAFAAGGILSTVDDLATWTAALHGGRVLRPRSLALMTSSARTSDGKATGYGFGLGVTERDGHRILGHGGGIRGYLSYLAADPEQRTVVVMLSNTDTPPALPLERLMDLACGRAKPHPDPVSLPDATLEALSGTYALKTGEELRVWHQGPGLKVQAAGQPAFDLLAEDPTHFFVKDFEVRMAFEQDGSGRAAALVLTQGGTDIRAVRR